MWIDGQPIDLHDKMTKSAETIATAINDLQEVLIEGMILRSDGSLFNIGHGAYCNVMTNIYVCHKSFGVVDTQGLHIVSAGSITAELTKKIKSIWMNCVEIISINDKGEAIALGKTIYGEEHAILLRPINSD